MQPELAMDDLGGYRWMVAAFIAKVHFSLDKDFLFRRVCKGQDRFFVFDDHEFQWYELERLSNRLANEDHFARLDSLLGVFWNRYFDDLTWQVSWERFDCWHCAIRSAHNWAAFEEVTLDISGDSLRELG
jgi:hypothetical protein